MDRKDCKENKQHNSSAGVAAAVLAVVLLAVLIQPSVRESSLKLAAADVGSINFAVSATGKVVPGYEETINAPISSRVLEVFKRAGDVVQAGEPLLKLDLAAAQAEYDKLEDEEQMKILRLDQMRISNRNQLSEMEMRIKIQEMELDRKEAALRNERYLDSLGAGTPDKVREAELAYTVASMEIGRNWKTRGSCQQPTRRWQNWSFPFSARTWNRAAAGFTTPASGLRMRLP